MKTASPVILVIDDEKNLLFGLQTVLRRNGYDVLTATTTPLRLPGALYTMLRSQSKSFCSAIETGERRP